MIFAVLWLLQRFYTGAAVSGVKEAARELAAQKNEETFIERIEEAAQKHSLLIFVTNEAGNVLYSADEYNALYNNYNDSGNLNAPVASNDSGASGDSGGALPARRKNSSTENPYLADKGLLNWEKGVIRNLPYSHTELLERLMSSGEPGLGYMTEDGAAYVYGVKLEDCAAFPGEDAVMCISMALGSVEGTVKILRIQLLWVSGLSLLLTFLLAFFLSKRFARPIRAIAEQAQSIARGEFTGASSRGLRMEADELPDTSTDSRFAGNSAVRGFCTELDELSDTLNETAASLERLERSRRELLANISHDLRTPLTMIRGYAEMVQEISRNDEEKRKQDLQVIIREADRLTRLVGEILEYSSMQALGEKTVMEDFDLSGAVQAVIRQFDPLCREQGFVIEPSIEPGLWIHGNRAQIERVIYNFMDNAVNHTGGSRKITVKLEKRENSVRLEVKDYGPGIPKEEIAYIWERYYTSRNRKNKGTVSGLGLSIAKEILTLHGMRFGAEGEDGCVFWFETDKI